jgi:hypothetical protein
MFNFARDKVEASIWSRAKFDCFICCTATNKLPVIFAELSVVETNCRIESPTLTINILRLLRALRTAREHLPDRLDPSHSTQIDSDFDYERRRILSSFSSIRQTQLFCSLPIRRSALQSFIHRSHKHFFNRPQNCGRGNPFTHISASLFLA